MTEAGSSDIVCEIICKRRMMVNCGQDVEISLQTNTFYLEPSTTRAVQREPDTCSRRGLVPLKGAQWCMKTI